MLEENNEIDSVGPEMAKRELTTISYLTDDMDFKIRKSLDLMQNLQRSNSAYRGNQEIINGLNTMGSMMIDLKRELNADLELFGGAAND